MNMISSQTMSLEERYQNALASRRAALEDVATAEAAEQRGNKELDAAREALAKFDNLSDAIARHRAGAVKAGKAGKAALPPKLIEDRQKQRDAEEYVQELEITQTLLHDEAEAARCKHREAHQAVINVSKLFMVEDFEKKAARLAELEAELIPLWREVWAFLDSFVAAMPGNNAPHAMPSSKMNSIKEMAVKYARIVPDEAGNMRNRHREAHHARLQSLIKGAN